MIVSSSNINMLSHHQSTQEHVKTERLNVWVDPPAERSPLPTLKISNKALEKASINPSQELSEEPVSSNIQILKLMLEKVFDLEFKLIDTHKLHEDINKVSQVNTDMASPASPVNQSAGYGLEYDYHEHYNEQETTTFFASGEIHTADGQKINFSVDLNMQRSFSESVDIRIREGDAKLVDPLIINFSGNAAELSQTTFSFDLDANGVEENIALLKSNSAFIAIDNNNDGKINDGSELFGALTGDGYAELAVYDDDNNQFIDENDAIYKKLQVWMKDENGKDELIAIANLGIGAIYLNNVATPFDLKNENNTSLGKIQSTSLYLTNNGDVGTTQKLDFVV